MANEFIQLKREDVVSVYSGQILVNNRTFTVSEIIVSLLTLVKAQAGWAEEKEKWFGEGLDCKVLKPGAKKWQRGKVRFTLEFIPEELEEEVETSEIKSSSPLDDIRQMMPKDN